LPKTILGGTLLVLMLARLLTREAIAGPNAEVARKCMRFSYSAYPYKRPGSVRMSGDRQSYFKDCMTKQGNVSEPLPPKDP
jgi:hypothetical protein